MFQISREFIENVIAFKPLFIKFFVETNAVSPLCSLLQSENVEVVTNALKGLKNIFEDFGADELNQKMDECDGYEKLHNLQLRGHGNIKRLADTLLHYFDVKPPPQPLVEVNFDRPAR